MPRNHGRTAILATWMVHSKIRTILRVLTILTILRSGFAQERSSFNKDNARDYLVEWDEAYGPPTGLSIFVKEVDNETSERDRSTGRPKETSEGSKEKRYPRWWKYKEERRRGEEDRWKKDVKKAVLTTLGGNTVRRTIGKEYFESKSSEEKTRGGIGEVKENEEHEEEKENRGNNEESSRSNEDRNSNNFMTKPRTPRNRKSEREKEEDREEDREESERSTGVRGRRSSWILRGSSIKRSIREDATRGNLSRKGEMSFSTASELDDDLRRHREKSGSSNRWRRRRKERKRRRRGANSFVTLDEWNASNRSSLEKHKVRTEGTRTTKEMGRGQEVIIKKKKEDGKFMTTIHSRDERQKRKETSEKRDEKKNGNRIETFEKKFRKEEGDEEDNASRRGVVDNFSEDTTFSSLSAQVRKSTRKEPDTANRGRLSADSRVRSRYQDNLSLDEKAVGFPFEKETENEDKTTTSTAAATAATAATITMVATTKTGRGNLVRDTTEEVDKEKGKGVDADLKSRKKNVLDTTHQIRPQRKRILKETLRSTELPTPPPSGSIKYTKKERYRDENWIGKSEVASLDRNESFSVSISSILATNVSLEKEKEKDRGDRGGAILSTTPMYFSREQKEKEEETVENESPLKNLGGDTRGGKESVVGSVGNISRNTVVSWNSTYPNHDTFDSSWVYSAGRPIVESNGRGAEESSKDSKRNVGDPMESSKSPKLLETFLPRFPIANGSIVKDGKSRTGNSGDLKTRGKVQRYEENEGVMKSGGKNFGRITSSVRDSRTGEKREKKEEGGGGVEEMKEKKISETISLEYFPRSTSLTNWKITTTQGVRGIEGSGGKAAEDREVSDYEKEINDTASEPASTYKFELLESVGELDSTTSSISTATSNDIREKTVGNEDRKEKDRKMERLKEEEDSSNSKQTILLKSKRSKPIGLSGIGDTSTDSNGKPRVAEKSGRNQETKTDESVDPISKSHGNVRSSWPRRDLTETTEDVSMAESSLERTSTVSSSPSDRSISVTGVEIEGITSSLLLDVPPTFPSDRFNTIAATTIEENPRASDTPERSTISWVETTIGNVSYRQSIGTTPNTSITNQWPVKHSAVVEGDLVLGGLMMVHEREDTITCGPVMPQGGVQALEAMLYTLDTLNQREIVPGVKIGAHILDDCDKDTYGLEMAVDFIKGSISNIDGAEYHCNKTTVRKVISGVVGAASSVTSIQVANLLRLFRIPQVSFFSTSPELSNKQRFEYFTRTIPSDHYQVKAMVDIVLKMGWSYVSIIYEESNYGIKAFEELEELLTKNDICIAVKEKLVKDSGVAEETAYDNIVFKLLTKPRAKGCIIFGSDQEVAGVMRAVRRCNATGAFSWIGSDGWSARGLVSNGNEAEVEGTLSVQPQANHVRGFEEYFLNLTVENNRRNPWFVEFWEDHFQCRYPNSSWTPYNKKYTKICSTKERLTKENTVFEDQLQFVSDAVMAFAYAFRDMHRDLCGGKAGLCDAMKPTKGTELLRYLRKVNFEGLSGDKFRFDKNGDGPARYNIIHFKQTEPGVYKWIRVGKYLEGVLHLNMSMVQFKLGHNQTPESVCSLPCEVGQAKKYVEGESCCWHCFNCSQYQIRHPDDETQCKNCRQGTVPDETHSTCREIPEEFLRLESGWAIGAMSFSAIGILVTLFVCGVFLKHNDTPVVRASGRELSYVLLTGILLCYLVTFALVLRPTDLVCSIQRFGAGFCFTVVYAALLTKTNRISRIFNAGKHSAKRPSFISPRSQLIICSGLVGVQILINGVWIIIDPAKAMHHYPTKEDNLLVCNSYIDASYMIAFAYPIMLIVVCTVYAVLTRKIPEAFNESKYIGFTMYTTCVIWLAFVPLYFGTGNHVALRITSMSVTISLSASVTIACLFTPKLYIILIRPERNVRQNIMPPRPYNTTKSSAVTGTNASSMMAPVTLTAVTCDQNKAVKKHIITTMDCSTQSEYYELEVKELKNGKPPPSFVSRATQTQSNNNEKEPNDGVHQVDKESKDNARQTNNTKIGNGPVNQNDVTL